MKIYPDSVTINNGTIESGTIVDVQVDDGEYLEIGEVTGAPGISIDFIFSTAVNTLDTIMFAGRYEGNDAHEIILQIYNYSIDEWEAVTEGDNDLPNATQDYNPMKEFDIPTPISNYVNDGEAKVRILHPDSGNKNHRLWIDMFRLCRCPALFEKRFLNQIAVYWNNPTMNGFGKYAFDNPIELECRWVQKQVKFMNERGEEELSSAIVYVDKDVSLGGYLYLGRLYTLAGQTDPLLLSNVYVIRGFEKQPNIDGDDFMRKAYINTGGGR